jgi:hypothetical protein
MKATPTTMSTRTAFSETIVTRIRARIEAEGIGAHVIAARTDSTEKEIISKLEGREEMTTDDIERLAFALDCQPLDFFQFGRAA